MILVGPADVFSLAILQHAPWPFTALENQPGTTRKVSPDQAKGKYLEKFLITLLQLPPNHTLIKDDYFLDSGISIVLNAYNMRCREREQRVWAFFHWRGAQSCLDVPSAPGPGFDWTRMQTQAEYAIFTQDLSNPSAQLARERQAPFPSVVAFPLRWRPNGKKVRLYCYFHRHEKPAGGRYDTQVYSLSVWDRENNQMSWHDPWHQGHAARFADIQTFWANAAPNWLTFTPPIVAVNYTSLAGVQAANQGMRPKFSQISCIALAVWLMGHLEEPAPLRPPDRADVLTGRMCSQFADLAAATLQTLRESSAAPTFQPHLVGSGVAARQYLRQVCRIRQVPENARFRKQLRNNLRMRFTENPNLVSQGTWILDAVAP
ncbi:hypothetical protein PG985_000002 [Apiospora marii]|uniref:Uncharacterized protein n=1 Tax=Apiospora marii TaxID=335849 RepID=A0ABR1R0G9_9PEZI